MMYGIRTQILANGRFLVALCAILLAGMALRDHAPDVAAGPQDEGPVTVLYSGVTDYVLSPPAVYWHESSPCNGDPNPKEEISLLPLSGGLPRAVYAKTQACGTSAVLSNVIADQTYLYWISPSGLVQLDRKASESDKPQIVNALIAGPGEIVDAGDRIYTMSRTGGNTEINYVLKDNKARVPVTTLSGDAFVLSFDGDYLYYLIGSTLIRLQPGGAIRELANGVTAYYPEGKRTYCSGGASCVQTHLVYAAKGNQIVRFSNLTETTVPTYTSPEATAVILNVTTDRDRLFLYERRTTVCDPLCSYTHNLVRVGRDGTVGSQDGSIYSTADLVSRMTVAEGFLYWREYKTPVGGVLKRLSTLAGPLSLNLSVNNMLITQGVQHLSNNVPLIEHRPTFVRVFAQSNGATAQGVTAFLYGSWGGQAPVGPLLPVNPAGTKLSVSSNYLQEDINQAFLFELPWEWSTKDDLRLRVELNPYRLPLETNYTDNSFTIGPFDFKPSGRLAVQFVSFGFLLNNQIYYPSLLGDVLANYSWIRRIFPLSSRPGFIQDPSPGFRPNNWFVLDAGLGAWVNRSSPECNMPPYLITDGNGKITKDERSSCASAYTNAQMAVMRQESNLPDELFMYGMIRDLGGSLFPRGQAGTNRISSGPAAPGWVDTILYAEHEIGHTLGRGHPLAGNGQCGLEGGDPSPSYPNARVGPQTGVVEGFDPGDPALGLGRRVLPGWNFTDFMAYCGPQWVSDQNYKNLFNAIPAATQMNRAQAAVVDAGTTILVTGLIDPASSSATFTDTRTGTSLPRRWQSGDYLLRFSGTQGNILAEHELETPEAEHSPGWLAFEHVVPFPQGVRRLEIVQKSSGKALTTRAVNADAPLIKEVIVEQTATPVLTLRWTTEVSDGRSLRYDVFFSQDGGDYRPLQFGLSGNSTEIDTRDLSGGEGRFRVIASDGVLAARLDSEPVLIAKKPPIVRIQGAANGQVSRYGQVINLSGEAQDPQGEVLSDADLQWQVDGKTVFLGPLFSVQTLPPGAHTIKFAATNSGGLTGTTALQVTVVDDLEPPAPYLSAAPAEVAWQVEAGETAVQSALVTLTNVGAGAVQWTAVSDKPWLALGPASGAGGDKLGLNADPAGLAEGMVHTAVVTVSAQGDDGQVLPPLQIPVTLVVGNLREGPPGNSGGAATLYLPMMTG